MVEKKTAFIDKQWARYLAHNPQEKKRKETCFSYLTISKLSPIDITQDGRLRWRSENEGFLEGKHRGYQLEHLFARRSFKALRIYHLLRLIAQLFNQLVLYWKPMRLLKKKVKMTWSHCFKAMIMTLTYGEAQLNAEQREPPPQVRYVCQLNAIQRAPPA